MKLRRENAIPEKLSPSGYCAAILIGLLLPVFVPGVAVTLVGCATLKSAGRDALIDCGKPALQAAVTDIAADVRIILNGGGVNWQAELDEYQAKGLDVLACAVARVGVALATAAHPMASAVVTPADRASYYLTSRGLHPANVPR